MLEYMEEVTNSRKAALRNALGFLRLLFASLVIIAHVPEIVDGSNRRELLFSITGTISFGSLAVFGFFIISGDLITRSLIKSKSAALYLRNRVARIYPGFVAASAVCLIIVAPLAGAAFHTNASRTIVGSLFRMTILARPTADHAFPPQGIGDPGYGLDGAMWTIQYEFACYLLTIGLGAAGLFRRRWPIPVLAFLLLGIATFAATDLPNWLSHPALFPGPPAQIFALPGMFLAGSAFYLYRDKIQLNRGLIFMATLDLCASMFTTKAYLFGIASGGTILIFAISELNRGKWLSTINNQTDISYGLYLYAWPIEQLLIRYVGTSSLLALALLTWIGAASAGWLSWIAVERPMQSIIHKAFI